MVDGREETASAFLTPEEKMQLTAVPKPNWRKVWEAVTGQPVQTPSCRKGLPSSLERPIEAVKDQELAEAVVGHGLNATVMYESNRPVGWFARTRLRQWGATKPPWRLKRR